ncbi:TonB-dependent siderophore receptor [Massilia aquatica]|uniref:TonB-dependent siderophore receptor n=1 Tax=Massilia aquatica TaxID=2609000 RepID=A0ABX0M2H7_9BURK|nr:TonB-dependent siderophore receptor [Massilia aquatica]NHZ39228.1 TonB-dependent siderophore receptor [Massilia aquatica]
MTHQHPHSSLTPSARQPAFALNCGAAAVRAVLLASLALGVATPARAQGAPTRSYQIAPGPLDRTLTSFASAAGIELSADATLLNGKTSAGLNATTTVQAGFDEVLRGHGLQALRQANGSYTLARLAERPAARGDARPAAGPAAAVLPMITVLDNAEPDTASGPIRGYVARRSATATKTDTPILETPQSLSVVGAEEIDTLKSQSLQDVLAYVAGVARNEAADRTTDQFFLRGFQATSDLGNHYRDGTRYGVTRYDGRQELYGLERVEVIKGAASVLFGAGGPGGIINTVSKRPTADPVHEVNVEGGSFKRKQISADLGGPLTDDGVWSYRLSALWRDSDTFIDHVPDNRRFVAPALTWKPNAATSLTLLGDYQKDRTVNVYGLPAEGTVLPNANGRIARQRFVGEPGFDQFALERYSAGYLFEHAFSDRLKLKNSLRYAHASNAFDYVEVWGGVDATERVTAMRWATDRADRSSSLVSDTSLQYQLGEGAVRQTMLAGLDYSRGREETERYTRSLANLDLFAPVYGSAVGAGRAPNTFAYKADGKRIGVYAQDQIKVGEKWVASLGGRYDMLRYNETGFFGGVRANNEKSHAFTGRAGLVYLADNGLAPFASYSTSFEPTTGVDRTGARFKPSEGKQFEAGLRYQPKGADVLLSAAVYQLTRQNVQVEDPQNANFAMQAGEVRSRGLELEARTRIGKSANLIAAYAYTDARTTKASPLYPEREGQRVDSVPYNQFSIWGDEGFGAAGLPGLRFGAGARYVGSTRGAAHGTPVIVPSVALIDAMASYSTGPWKLALNVTNLADKTYIGSCTYGCFYGEPRKVIVTASYRW